MSEKPPVAPQPKQNAPLKGVASSKWLFILVIVVIVLGAGGLLWYLHARQYESTDDATLVGHIHPVAPRIAGTIAQVLVDDNQYVKQGQVVAVIDSRDYELALSQAEHNLLNARTQSQTAQHTIGFTEQQASSQMTQAQGTVGSSQSSIEQSRQAVDEARSAVAQAQHTVQEHQATYRKAQSDYARFKGTDPEAVSAQQVEAAATTVQNEAAALSATQAALKQTQSRLAQAQTKVGASVSQLTQAKGVAQSARAQNLQVGVVRSQYQSALAAVKVAEDQVRQAKLNLTYTKILAPTDGRVGRRTVEVGQRVQSGEQLMAVVSPDIWVVANYKETQLGSMRPGQPVGIEVDAFPHHHFEGIVDSFSPASGSQFALLPPENATGNFTKIVQRIPVKILLTRASVKGFEDILAPGMSTVVTVEVGATPKRRENKHVY